VVAPGAHIVAPLAPGSDFAAACPSCLVDGRYFRLSGTSMAAPIVAGIAADILSVHPNWTPNQVKGALTYNSGQLGPARQPIANMRLTADGAWEVAADLAVTSSETVARANQGLTPSDLIDPRTGDIDPVRASWGRATWWQAVGELRASWGRASWGCYCSAMTAAADPTRASWGRASWGSFFGDSPQQFGELQGGRTGAVGPRTGLGVAATAAAGAASPAAANALASAATAAAGAGAGAAPQTPDPVATPDPAAAATAAADAAASAAAATAAAAGAAATAAADAAATAAAANAAATATAAP
jgi:Subtilase family